MPYSRIYIKSVVNIMVGIMINRLKKIKNMEEKLLHGSEAMEKALKQEQDLLKTKSELEEKRIMQMRLEQELKAKDEEKVNLEHRYTSQ